MLKQLIFYTDSYIVLTPFISKAKRCWILDKTSHQLFHRKRQVNTLRSARYEARSPLLMNILIFRYLIL